MFTYVAFVVSGLLSATTAQQGPPLTGNGLAITPAMGFDNWNAFACDVSEDLLLGTAQKIVDYSLRDAGYNYVILDDCYSDGRYENGSMRPDFSRFPNGMKHVGDRIHALGLKFGMYSSAGNYTCGGYVGSLGYEEIDAQTFASWGVDFLKYDNCYNAGQSGTKQLSYDRYNAMSMALNKTGRPIHYNMCSWGEDSPWDWATTIANSWRMSGDITDSFSRPGLFEGRWGPPDTDAATDYRCPCSGDEPGFVCVIPGFHCSVLSMVLGLLTRGSTDALPDIMNKFARYPSKTIIGSQADLDALEVGNGGMTDNEYVTHMSIWALSASQLIMGTDIRKLDAKSLSIYSNPAVLAVNQDPTVGGGKRLWRYFVDDKDENGQGEIALWSRKMNNSDVVVAMVNAGSAPREMNTTLAELFINEGGKLAEEAQMDYDVYDLWANRMGDDEANMVLNGTAAEIDNANSTTRWNATATSYADGLNTTAPALMGKKIGSVPAMGTLTAQVPRHSTALLRLRSTSSGKRKRDEL